ncbi:essential protein-like protein Yae1 [Aureobasidium pullulans]|uniref:Protein YAE1 n=1 Tax=Aureobasidium pullulans TaxID=5580 RepID=A0A4S8Z0M7_AURPU|nr:essential protein-like protein Yae1 [Aureobasidium pullulans]
MLREVPGVLSVSEMSPSPEPITTSELHDDIFGSSPNSPILSGRQENENDIDIPAHVLNTANSERSDIPRLRSTHVTNGYRDGISVSKAEHVQHGFDEGFSLGAVLGIKSGFLLGVLEGIVRAIQSSATIATEAKEDVIAKFVLARSELGLQSLFGREWFGEDGIWKFDVKGKNEEEVTFRDVADAHPLVDKWVKEVESLKKKFGFEIQARARDEEDETTS